MAKKTSVTHESRYRLTSKGFVTKNKTYRGIKNVFVTVGGVYRLAWGDAILPDTITKVIVYDVNGVYRGTLTTTDENPEIKLQMSDSGELYLKNGVCAEDEGWYYPYNSYGGGVAISVMAWRPVGLSVANDHNITSEGDIAYEEGKTVALTAGKTYTYYTYGENDIQSGGGDALLYYYGNLVHTISWDLWYRWDYVASDGATYWAASDGRIIFADMACEIASAQYAEFYIKDSGGNYIYSTSGEIIGGNYYLELTENYSHLGGDTHTHEWIKDEESSTEPTCTAIGTCFYYCSCGEQYHEDIPALGHSMMWVDDIITPSCETKGKALFKCTRCGAEEERDIPAIGHDYKQSEVKEPTCEDRGYTAYQCQNCFHSYADYVAALGHKLEVADSYEPTCTESGKIIYACVRTGCDYEETVYTDNPLGHNWQVADSHGCVTDYFCPTCGASKTEDNHNWVDNGDGTSTCFNCWQTKNN